jgi:hypothetical protein
VNVFGNWLFRHFESLAVRLNETTVRKTWRCAIADVAPPNDNIAASANEYVV